MKRARAVLIQARTGSKRLPGKVLMDIEGKTMLERVLERCPIEPIVMMPGEDKQLADFCLKKKIRFDNSFQFSPDDVLGRFHGLPIYHWQEPLSNLENPLFARITADCPLVDGDRITQCFDVYEAAFGDKPGIVTLAIHPPYEDGNRASIKCWPDGADCQVFSREALDLAHEYATHDFEREHVVPWMFANLPTVTIEPAHDYPAIKLSVDREEDLKRIRNIYQSLKFLGRPPTLDEAVSSMSFALSVGAI